MVSSAMVIHRYSAKKCLKNVLKLLEFLICSSVSAILGLRTILLRTNLIIPPTLIRVNEV